MTIADRIHAAVTALEYPMMPGEMSCNDAIAELRACAKELATRHSMVDAAKNIQRRDIGSSFKVYVSGPYTKGDPCENTHRAIVAGNAIFDAGHVPFVPHVSHFWHTVTPRPYEDWLKLDLAFLPACDFVLRLSGESSGADREVAAAESLGILVFYDLEALLRHLVAGEEVPA